MARTIIVPEVAVSPYSTIAANAADYTYAAATVTDFDKFASTGKELLLVRNVHATVAKTVTIQSAVDPYNREGDIVYSLGALENAQFGPFPTQGWRQSDGYIWVDGEDANITYAVVRLP